jgi:tripartite-type tricarboxylate transporter receptor subunit TctC
MNKLLLVLLATLTATITFAKQPLEITAPHGPGGPSDNVARALEYLLPAGEYMTVNRPGAASQIGTRHAINNNTLLITSFVQVFVANSDMQEDMRKLIDTELEIVAAVGVMPSVLICNKDLNIKTINDLKNYPKILNFGTNGPTSSSHLTTEVLFRTINKKHNYVFYPSGQAKISNDLIGGHLDCAFGLLSGMGAALQSPRVHAVISSHKVDTNTPSWEEVLKTKFPFNNVMGLTVSRNMSEADKNKIKSDLVAALAKAEAKTKIENAGFLFYPRLSSSEIANEIKHIGEIKKYFAN